MKYLLGLFIGMTIVISCKNLSLEEKTKQSLSDENKAKKESTAIPLNPDVVKGKLSNGLTYYIKKNAKPSAKVELRLVVNVGSILETEEQQGLAHFMEHMNFNGTKNFSKNELVNYLQSIGVKFGAHLNAYTGFDETVYILPIPSDDNDKLEKGFQILEDWAFNANLTAKDIDEERGVVLEELRIGMGAERRMLDRYLPKLMNNSRYAERLPIGKKEVLEHFDYEALRSFYKKWYRPDLMAVVAVGDIDVLAMEKLIKKHFEQHKSTEPQDKRPYYKVPNHQETFISVEKEAEATNTQVAIYYKDLEQQKPLTTSADYKASMTKSLFTQMLNYRLYELRNGENPPFIYGSTSHGKGWARNHSQFQAFALASETKQLDAFKALLTEIRRVQEYGFLQTELERTKKSLLSRLEKDFNEKDKNSSSKYASQFINHYLHSDAYPSESWIFEFAKKTLPTITVADCNALIKQYIHEDNRVIVFTSPEKKEIKPISSKQILEVTNQIAQASLKPYTEEAVAANLMNVTPKKGRIVKVEKDTVLGVEKWTLSNGAKLTYKKTNFKNDEILFSAFSYGGTSMLTVPTLKQTIFGMDVITQLGVNGYKITDLGKMMAGKRASVTPYIGSESEGLSGSCSPKDLKTLFELVHLNFTKLNKDAALFESYKLKRKAYLKNILSNPTYYFLLESNAYLANGNPRYFGFPKEGDWANLSLDKIHETYTQRFANAGDFNFYFVGNIDEAQLAAYATTYLASLPSNGQKERFKVYPSSKRKGIHRKEFFKGTDPKSYVQIIYEGETTYDKEEAMMVKVLGQILNIKLIEELREKEAGVYGVSASANMVKYPSARYRLQVSFPCGPENVEKLIQGVYKEVEKIKQNGPLQKDIDKVKATLSLEHKERLEKNQFWLQLLEKSDFNQNKLEQVYSIEEDLNSITADKIQTVAKKYLTANRATLVLKPEEK